MSLVDFEDDLPYYRERGTSFHEAVYTPEAVAVIVKEAEERAFKKAADLARETEPDRVDFEGYPQWGSYPQYAIADKILKEVSDESQ